MKQSRDPAYRRRTICAPLKYHIFIRFSSKFCVRNIYTTVKLGKLTDYLNYLRWEKATKSKKRKNSSDNYMEQPKTPKHGGSNNEAINTVSDILRNANETLYNTSLSNLDNSVFDRDSPAPHQSRCEITNSPTEVRRHLDIPEKYIHGTPPPPHEDVSRLGVCQQTCIKQHYKL